MTRIREEILPGVCLTALTTDRFKTDTLSVSFLTQLERDTASLNALTPRVLVRGSERYPDMEAVAAASEALYGAQLVPFVRRFGEIQSTGFIMSFLGSTFVPESPRLLEEGIGLCFELLLKPNRERGMFKEDYVESEKIKLIDRIKARKNDKGSWAVTRLIEHMCAFEDFSTSPYGDESRVEEIDAQSLTAHYSSLLETAPIELFYCGGADYDRVATALKAALSGVERTEINYDIGTHIRLNALEEEPRYYSESMDVTQGKLAIGFRLGDCMEEPDEAAIRVMNAVYGSGVMSKLFMNVRERLSLCYYASSSVDLHKGLMVVTSGIDFDKYEAAKDEIFAQLEAVREGKISDEELLSAKVGLASDLLSLGDSPLQLESYWQGRAVMEEELEPEELAELCMAVQADTISEIAKGMECDSLFFLRAEEGTEHE